MVVQNEVAQKLAVRDQCRSDRQYLSEILGYDFVPQVHAELFNQYFDLDPNKPWALQSAVKKVMILWSRGHYKTTSVIVFIVQIILNFPDIRILLMRGSLPTTQELLHEIKCHFTGEAPHSRLREFFPEFCADRLGTVNRFTVPARKNKGIPQDTVTVASPKSIKTGQHFDIGFFDDVVNESNYDTKKKLEKVKRDFYMCLPLLDPPHYAIVTGTRYAFGDLYEELKRHNRGEWRISLTTCYLANGQIRFPQQRSRDGDKLIGFTEEGLNALRESSPETFHSQYLNQPIQKGGKQLPRTLLESAVIPPSDAPALSEAVFFVDIASGEGDQADDSVIVVGKHDQRMRQYVVEVNGGKWNPQLFGQNVIEMALKFRPLKIMIEKTASGVYFGDLLKLMAQNLGLELPIDYMKVSNKDDAKSIRIGTLLPLIKTKRFFFFQGITRWEKILEQCERYTPGSGNHDDYPDTLGYMAQIFGGQALAMPLQKPLSRDPVLAMMEIAERSQPVFPVKENTEPDDGADGFMAF